MQKKLLKELIAEMEKLRVCAGEISREIQEEKLLSSVTVQQMLCGLETVQVLQKDCEEMFRNEGYEVDSVAEMRQALAEYEKKRDEETLLRVKKVLSIFCACTPIAKRPRSHWKRSRQRSALIRTGR